jgi:hypothetical protein
MSPGEHTTSSLRSPAGSYTYVDDTNFLTYDDGLTSAAVPMGVVFPNSND